ncbi:hypothetical protein GOBAR_AA28464 [Gossypium barbadense]|uniref:Uncharacterized protein n=1 Tax=Gossypium barbadense TaxID=3634 RepID=A0A2P5WM97_GOSBA|nr:hypothetical protein GOBAR_AA28464 [Gossypium barbadense]
MDVGRMESMSFKDKLIQDWGLSSARNNKVVEDDDIEIKDEGVITVQPWSFSFTTLIEFPSEVCVWIPLPRLPKVMYKNSIFNAIENTIGKVVKIDYNTKNGTRGRFTRMALFMDLKRPLISKLFIDGKLQRVEYKRLPNVCF